MASPSETFNCPHCGFELPVSAKACKNCGSDESTGWSEDANPYSSEPPPDFDYAEAVEREFGDGQKSTAKMPSWVALTGMALLILFLWVLLK